MFGRLAPVAIPAQGLEVAQAIGAAFGDWFDVVYFEFEVGVCGGGLAAGLAAEAVAFEDVPAGADRGLMAGAALGFLDAGEELFAREFAGVVEGEEFAGFADAAPVAVVGNGGNAGELPELHVAGRAVDLAPDVFEFGDEFLGCVGADSCSFNSDFAEGGSPGTEAGDGGGGSEAAFGPVFVLLHSERAVVDRGREGLEVFENGLVGDVVAAGGDVELELHEIPLASGRGGRAVCVSGLAGARRGPRCSL